MDFTQTFKKAIQDRASQAPGQQLLDRREEIAGILEEVRAAMEAALEGKVRVTLEPWISTEAVTRRQVVLRRVGGAHDGAELKAFVIAIPFDGYPVTIEVGSHKLVAEDRDKLEAALREVLSESAVVDLASQMQALP